MDSNTLQGNKILLLVCVLLCVNEAFEPQKLNGILIWLEPQCIDVRRTILFATHFLLDLALNRIHSTFLAPALQSTFKYECMEIS